MPLYTYIATDFSGGKRSGTVDARSESIAVTLLKNQGLFVISINEKRSSFLDDVFSIMGVPINEIVAFTRQFSTMISAGLPLSRALEVLADQTQNKTFKGIILDCLRSVEGGTSLSEAFARHPKVFGQTYQALVKAGESSGRLDEILKRLATNMEAERELDAKFKAAMIYPAIVFLAMVGVFVLLMILVVPKLASMYKSLNVQLPLETQIMIGISDFMINYWYIAIGIVVLAFFFGRYYLGTEDGQNFASFVAFRLPVFGKINKQKDITQFTRTLGLLISSAIPIVEALNIVGKVIQNKQLRDATLVAAKTVEKGNSLSDYFKSNTKVYPPLLGQMVSVGEETGQIDQVLTRVADYFEGETDNAVKGLSAALEPLILIMLGAMVGVLIVSIITPIYKITSSIQ